MNYRKDKKSPRSLDSLATIRQRGQRTKRKPAEAMPTAQPVGVLLDCILSQFARAVKRFFKMEKVYKNARTGEIVEDHRAAVEMFRAGDNIIIQTATARDSFGFPVWTTRCIWEH